MFKSVIAKRIQIDTSLMLSHKNVQKHIFYIIFVFFNFDVFEHPASPERPVDLSNAKYHLLSWLCSECNDPQCNNSNQQNTCSSISNTVQLQENVPGNITTNNITNSTRSESSNTSRDSNEHIACRNHDDGNITTVSQDFFK